MMIQAKQRIGMQSQLDGVWLAELRGLQSDESHWAPEVLGQAAKELVEGL